MPYTETQKMLADEFTEDYIIPSCAAFFAQSTDESQTLNLLKATIEEKSILILAITTYPPSSKKNIDIVNFLVQLNGLCRAATASIQQDFIKALSDPRLSSLTPQESCTLFAAHTKTKMLAWIEKKEKKASSTSSSESESDKTSLTPP